MKKSMAKIWLVVGAILLSGGYLYYQSAQDDTKNVLVSYEKGDGIGEYIIPTPKLPSEKSLKVAAYIYSEANERQKQMFMNKFSTTGMSDTVRAFALSLDSNPEDYAFMEALMIKDLAQKSAPNYYVEETYNNDSDYQKIQHQIDNQQRKIDDLEMCASYGGAFCQ